MAWFRGLTAPRWQLPLPALLVVGALYYGDIGYVLARSIDRRDARSTAWSLAVLVGNEAWNGAFFGRRSAPAGLASLCVFLVPPLALQRSVAGDVHSRRALAPYTGYVLLYDLPWMYRLWRLNPTRSEAPHRPEVLTNRRRSSARVGPRGDCLPVSRRTIALGQVRGRGV